VERPKPAQESSDRRRWIALAAFFALAIIGGTYLILATQAYLAELEELAEHSPDEALRKTVRLFKLVVGAMSALAIAAGLYVARYSQRIIAAQRWPPPGTWVIKDRGEVFGERAVWIGRLAGADHMEAARAVWAMKKARHLRAIIALPFLVLVVFPTLLTLLGGGLKAGWGYGRQLDLIITIVGALLILDGLLLLGLSISQFMTRGEGTLAPWDPTQKLVVEGIYRYVRNPMHSGVFMVLYGEGLMFASMPILIFATAFVLIHLLYIPLSEERGLERRFGEEFKTYKKNVPRWIPRLTAWDQK
jgi:protein-S-isoprenylcysteine O-methyltransferase Ste14